MEEVKKSWSVTVILLSYAISFTGSYVAVCLCEQYRLSRIFHSNLPSKTLNSNNLVLMMSICMGGVGVWCMHFIGMGAIQLKTESGIKIRMGYDINLTIASIFVVVVCMYLGFLIASLDRAYSKTKEEILQMIVEDTNHSGVRVNSKKSILLLVSCKGIWILMIGGLVTATGICAMHYLGMVSQRFDGHMEWDIGMIAASVTIAFIVSVIAFWIMFRLLALYPYVELLRVASAMVMGLAVNAMHYTGMYGARFYYNPLKQTDLTSNSIITSGQAFGIALLLGSVAAWTLAIVALRDIRSWYYHYSGILQRTDDIFRKAAMAPHTPVNQFTDKYMKARGLSFVGRRSAEALLSPERGSSLVSPPYHGRRPSPQIRPEKRRSDNGSVINNMAIFANIGDIDSQATPKINNTDKKDIKDEEKRLDEKPSHCSSEILK